MCSLGTMTMTMTVIVPVKNEERILRDQINKFHQLNFSSALNTVSYIFVCNGCTDSSEAIARDFVMQHGGQVLVLNDGNYGEALYQGIMQVETEIGMIINVEQWPTIDVKATAFNLQKDVDIIVFSKVLGVSRQPIRRKFLTWILNTLLKFALNSPFSDTHGPKIFKTQKVKPIASVCKLRFGQFDTELLLRAWRSGLRCAETPFSFAEMRPPKNPMVVKIIRNMRDVLLLIFFLKLDSRGFSKGNAVAKLR